MGRHYKALLPCSHLIFVSDAGHAPNAERQEAFVVTRRRTMIFP